MTCTTSMNSCSASGDAGWTGPWHSCWSSLSWSHMHPCYCSWPYSCGSVASHCICTPSTRCCCSSLCFLWPLALWEWTSNGGRSGVAYVCHCRPQPLSFTLEQLLASPFWPGLWLIPSTISAEEVPRFCSCSYFWELPWPSTWPLCASLHPVSWNPETYPPSLGWWDTEGPPCSLPQLAPENTLMSLRKTAECGAAVFETDVMVSSDGIPFLMHDEHLSRTTDVASVFPARITDHSSDFSWAELKRLNAGAWFLERRPFWGAKRLSGRDRKEAETQTVPMLEELLKEAAVLNLSIMFDLRRPPRNHTYYDTFVNQTLETVLSSRVPQAMVLWLPDEDRAHVQKRAPRMRQIYGQQGGDTAERPQFLNLPYQDLPLLDIKGLHQDNVSVNLFVVNKAWLFSLLWCAGVDSVTTNDCQLLQQMRHPVWLIPPQTYLMMWLVTDGVSILLLLWTFLLHGRCAQERQRTGFETAVLLTRINNFIME
ncbi:glycerophosphoinositol inositolphosphodiesterase GDPD2 isoform X2 [Rhinolophus sinicus]|uniref:glycerophosphoinositol inositolphosphodiesterase GDPD2 isoform X2 n=1 Tax=Rhinolophus sinicus TaxID=89399 RepID=UPI003D7A6F18